MLPSPFTFSSQQRSFRSTTHDITPFLHNLIYQYTNPLPFETEAHSIHTIPLLREHLDAYLYYFRYKTLEITQSQQPFQVIFNPIPGINNGTFYRTIHPRNLTLPIQNIFTSYINQLIEHNENLDTPIYRPSLLEELKEKVDLFEVPDLDTKIIRHNNPHYWLQQDILQVTTFQYKFFKNITLDDDTIPQIKVFSHFLLKFFRFNYQLIWEPKDQNAYIHFPQILNKTELLPFIIQNNSKHPYYKNFTTLHPSHIEAIELNTDFLIEQSETSDSRPYINLFQNNTMEEENQSSEISDNPHYTHSTQDHNTTDENVIQHQPTTPRHTSQITHDPTESVQDTITNPPNTSSTTTDSNALQVPTRNITETNTYLFNQENPSTISMTNDTETLSSSIHQTIPRNYDPPPPPSIHSTHSTPHNSPQQGSSNTFFTQQPPLNETQFQTTTPPIQSPQTIPYIPAQIPVQYNNPPILTINTLHTNPISNVTTSSTLSRPPLPLIQNNPLMYNLTSTNIQSQLNTNNTQTNLNELHSNTHHQTHLPSTITHPPPHIHSVPIQPQVNVLNIPPTSSNPSTLHTIPPNTIPPSTINTPTYINSATSISEPIKPFDGLDHNYTPEEYLQHIEARVTFSLGLQPHTTHEYKFWHARRMAFIQCSLTGTALSWYIRLNDTYKQDWHAFVQAFKKQFSSQKNAYYAQVEALSLTKKDNETVRHFALRVQQLVEKGWCNENASTINLKCNEIFTKGLPKNLKDFANKRQVKHTSTVLEPSIPFHTLVKLVDAEDIANDKIRTHDLTLEVNNLTKQLQSQSLNQQQTDQIMFTQPRDPNNKTKPAYKKYCSYCHRTNHSISACFKKQRDDEDKRDRYARSKSPQKSFVQYFRSSSNDRTQRYDTRPNEYHTRYRSRSTSRHEYQKPNRQRSISRTRYNYDRTTTPPHYTRSRYDNYQQAHSIHTIPLLREHLDAYLYYFRYKTLEITQSQQPFQVIFNPIPGINNGTFYRTIHPRNLTLPIQNIFTSYINQLIEHNENLDTPIYRPSLLEELKEKVDLFEVPDLDTKIIRHNNPHYWHQQDILQVTTFQYKFFKNITLDDDTIPQIKVFSHFLLKFFRFNYQLIWEPKDQNAYIHFPQILNKTELLPFIIQNNSKHPYYKNFTTLHPSHIEAIELNTDFLIEQSETSDSRPYINLFQNNTMEEENQSSEISDNPHYTHSTQDHNTTDENVIQHQPTTPRHTSQITHDPTESVQDTITNPPNTSSTTTDSNALQVPTRNITETNTYLFNQENPSTISMTNDTETLSSSIHQTIPRNYDPPPPPSIHSTHSTPHNSPQQGSSNTFFTQQPPLNETQFQTTTPPIQSPQTIPYIPAQIPVQYNNPPILTINTLHTNPISNVTTSSTLSRPPLPLIQNNPLMYNLTSTNIQSQLNTNNTQTNLNELHSNTHHQTHLPSTITHPPPHIHSVPIQPQVNVLNIPPTSSNPSTLHTIPPNTIPPSTINTPTYINSATSISEPIKPFDGLDHNYTPEEYLQHIEARVTFSLGLQPHTTHEYKFWHARRMAFIQCSLTGTALSWYIRLNDTYKQDWHAFVQAFKKQFSSQKNAYYAQVEALSLTKKDNETVRHFALRVQQLVEKGWCNENASTINLKCNEIFTKGLPKNLKDFANKRQVKHTSTVLEPSIPFHTLVKLVDAEDIANDKIRTHDLTLEVNNLTKQLQSQSLNQQQTDQIMFTQPREPNNKTKPAYKKYCSYCHRTNHSISACFKKQRDDEDKRDRYARSKSPQKSFVQYFRSSSNDRTQRYDTRPNEYHTRYRSRSTSRHEYQKPNRQRSISRTRYNYDRTTTPPHYTRSRYDNYQRDSRSHRSPYRSSYRSPHKRDSHSRYRSRSYSRDNNFSRYTSSYRPPSRPRDSRYSRSRSHSQTRNKINTIQQQNSNDPINFEIHMYHPTEMANALTPTSWFYSLDTHTPSNQIHRDYPSRLEISFLLDSGASISVLNHPTYITIAKLLNIKQTSSHNSSKTLTVANQTEVPILHYTTITLNTTIDDNSRQFTIPFAVADIKYNILGTPFFEENIQNINIQDFTLHFKNHSRVYPNYAKFTSLLSKDYPYFSYIYRINSKTQIRLKPNTSKIAHFPINNYYNLHFSTTPQKQFFPTIPHTYFSSKFRTTFNFIEVFSDDKPDTCATIIQNSTNHIATLPTGHIGYIEVPITNEKPKYYQVNDINTLTHLFIMLLILTILKLQKLFHPLIIQQLQNNNQYLQHNFH